MNRSKIAFQSQLVFSSYRMFKNIKKKFNGTEFVRPSVLSVLYSCREHPAEEHSIEVHNSRRTLDRLTVALTLTLTFDL